MDDFILIHRLKCVEELYTLIVYALFFFSLFSSDNKSFSSEKPVEFKLLYDNF